jgi:hypothetical protein
MMSQHLASRFPLSPQSPLYLPSPKPHHTTCCLQIWGTAPVTSKIWIALKIRCSSVGMPRSRCSPSKCFRRGS